jgi:5-methylcytosine-specific restriction endonuclease McrBC GTP-binding regulatory subunit McrB
MSYKIDEERLGCLIEIYADFLERNSNYTKQRNENLDFFKEILNKINNDKLTGEDIEKIFTKTRNQRKLYSAVSIKYKEEKAKLNLINFIKTLVNFGEELRTKNKLDEVIDEFVKKMQPSIGGWKIGDALVTELLCLFYPEKYCIKNNKVGNMIKKLKKLRVLSVKDNNFYKDYDKLIEFEGVILKYMQSNKKLKNVYQKIINRTNMNYYDVDAFLYWNIDDNYKEENNPEILNKKIEQYLDRKSEDGRSLKTLANYFQYKGFYFDQALITAFYSALKTKGFVILSGLTGTGKTKLAQLFADLVLVEKNKENNEVIDSSINGFIINVQHYMLRYNRMYIPSNQLHLLGATDVKQGVNVKVVINNEVETCRLVEYTNSPVALYFNKKLAEWFKNNLKKGDQLLVRIELSEDNQVEKFILQKVEAERKYFPSYRFLSVRPDWRDTKALLGYYNPINKTYESTSLLKFILEAKENYENNKNNAMPYFMILDEMNLSHVEYYFADFLSVLESGRDDNYWTKETIKLHNSEEVLLDNNGEEIPKEIKLPPNLYIIGSVNIDETTYMFSPKVLDRAFTIEFRDVNFDDYLASLQNEQINISEDELTKLRNALLNDLRNNGKFCAAVGDKSEIKNAINVLEQEIKGELSKLNQILQPYNLHFGYRVLDEIALFVKYATSAPVVVGKLEKEHALDFAVLMKVLPKFHGPRQKLERPLWLVLSWCLGNSAKFDNKTVDDLIIGIWKELSRQDKRPSIEDFTCVIQKLKSELNNRSKNESQEANPESQTIGENQNHTTEESPESTSEAHQTEQTSKDEKAPIINRVKYQRTAIKVLTMLRQLYETGFTSFA